MSKRSLYQCFQAKVKGDRIFCAKGHDLSKMTGDIAVTRLVRGEPLELAVCQDCNDYDEMGGPVAPEDRGWAHLIGLPTTKRRGRPNKGGLHERHSLPKKVNL